MDTINIIMPLLTLALGGGATWMFTVKYDRKQAEATAMEKLQDVYQRMITDLNSDRGLLKTEISGMKEELVRLEGRLKECERIMGVQRLHCCRRARECSNFLLKEIN